MKKLLIELPHNASTDKYDKYFPYPIHLMKIMQSEDKLIDLNLNCYKKTNAQKLTILDACITYANENAKEYDEIVVCAGSYVPDADKKTYYEYFLSNIAVPITLTGPYVDIFNNEIKQKFSNKKINLVKTDYNFEDFRIKLDFLEHYPKVANELKINMRITQGCPRMCAMCPVPLVHKGKYRFYNIDKMLDTIKYYYDNGVRFFNLIDDNMSCTPKFITFLEKLQAMKLKGAKFMCQEGFEVLAFQNEKFCELIKANNFVDIKLGIENIKEDFLIKINKYYNKFSVIESALANIQKYKLDVKMYMLIGLDETITDIEDNLRFICSSGFAVRCNIIRPYEGSELYESGFTRTLDDKALTKIKSFIHAISWLNETYKINYYSEKSLETLKTKMGFKITKDANTITVTGKVYFGFKTSKFILILQTLLEKQLNIKLKCIKKDKTELIFQKERSSNVPKLF